MYPNELEVTLFQAFPWVARLSSAQRQLFPGGAFDGPIGADEAARDALADALAATVQEFFADEPLSSLLPCPDGSADVQSMGFSNRGTNLLLAHGARTAAECTALCAAEIAGWRNSGALTVRDILRRLAGVAMTAYDPILIGADSGAQGERAPRPVAQVWGSGALVGLVADLRELSVLLGALGKGERSPFGGFDPAQRSPRVDAVLARVLSYAAADLFPGETDAAILARELDATLRELGDRDLDILRARIFADEQATLDEIGERHDLTRERIRQLVNKAVGRLATDLEASPLVSHAGEVVRATVSHVIPVEELVAEFPALDHLVESVGQPVWRVLDRLDDAYEIKDGWVAAPTVAEAVSTFRADVTALAGRHGLVPVADVRALRPDEWTTARRSNFRRWLDYCGLETLEGFVMVGRTGMLERAVAILAASAEPLSADAILDRLGIDRSIRSLKNQMSEDDRFVRVGRNAWALAEWGMAGYTSIRDAIRETLEAKGGSADLAELADAVSDAYGVQRQSVIAYATTYPFESRAGVVRYSAGPRRAAKTPAESRRVYRRGGDWLFRAEVSHDHVRGSGSLMPSGFAHVLELAEGDSTEWPATFGDQSFYWTGMQPTFGSVKAELAGHGFAEGDEVFFVLAATGRFVIEPVPLSDGSPRADLLAAIGHDPAAEVDDLVARVGTAVGVPGESDRERVRAWLLGRGETDLALLLDDALVP